MQPSSMMATYYDCQGRPVFDTFFILATIDGEQGLFALSSPDHQAKTLEAMRAKGKDAQAVTHAEAFLMVRNGVQAWSHMGDVPSENVWIAIDIKFPAAVA